MARQTWNILANTFELKTRGSFRKAFVFSERHYALLKGGSSDAAILAIFNGFKPVHEEFEAEFVKWQRFLGDQEGATLDFQNTLLLLQSKLKAWESGIYYYYPEGTREAVTIFPNKRTPFYKGSHIVRTEAVDTLLKQLAAYPVLATVKADVADYYAVLQSKLMKCIGNELMVSSQSAVLEKKRKLVANEIYGNLGLLMHRYRSNTDMIKAYFDMGVLKNAVHRKKKKKEKK